MTLREYCEYIKNPDAVPRARVVVVQPGESWTTLRLFHDERVCHVLRLSDLIKENAWLPMPDEVFGRVDEAMASEEASGKTVVLLGMPGYLALLAEENKRAAIVALREWVDGVSGREAVGFLRSDDSTGLILKDVFKNPRYRQGIQLIEIDDQQDGAQSTSGRMELTIVGDDLSSFIPETCHTFQKYLRYTEEHPNDRSDRRIVITSKWRPQPGLSAEVGQVVNLRDFAKVFYDIEDTELSEDALQWMCELGKEGAGEKLTETLKKLFFPESGVTKRVLSVFDGRKGAEREAALWLVKQIAPKGSYLERVASQENVIADKFRSAYIAGATQWLDNAAMYSAERRDAIQEAGVRMSDAGIRQFITHCKGESTSRVASWLNCGTDAEKAELLRRCAVDGLVSNAVKDVYSDAAAYLYAEPMFDDATLEDYFREYRELKMANRVTPEFYERTQRVPLISVQSRDTLLQRHASDNGCALLVVDAMGAEWLPMLVALAQELKIDVHSFAVGQAKLPTSTKFNNISWPDARRLLPDIKHLDNIAHNGAEMHASLRAEENLAAALDVIGSYVLPRVAEGLTQFERVLVTADHGSSRLAVLAWQKGLAKTLACEAGVKVADWRYREQPEKGGCPPELEETLGGTYWVVRGYDRLPKKGGGQGFEIHGGATLEERLVPVVIFSRTGQFVTKAKKEGKRTQIVEKDDFDL